jgi:hypothetical protein
MNAAYRMDAYLPRGEKMTHRNACTPIGNHVSLAD